MLNKLLVFTESYTGGGGNRYMVDLVNAVYHEFDTVTLSSNHGGISGEDLNRVQGKIKCQVLPVFTRTRIHYLLAFLNGYLRKVILKLLVVVEPALVLYNIFLFVVYIRITKPDRILVCNGGYPGSQACLALAIAARFCSTPATMSIVSTPTKRRRWFEWYDKLLDRSVWRSTRCVISNANVIALELERLHEMPRRISRVIYNGVADCEGPVKSLTGSPFTLGYVGRIESQKGVFDLLSAFGVLRRRGRDVQLIIAGDGVERQKFLAEARRIGLERYVTLLGHYSGDICELMNMFDVFVFPSYWEGLPYVILEAMRSARVIVTTPVGGIPEAIKDGEEGLIIPPGEPGKLAEAIEIIMDEPLLRESLASKARNKYEMEFALEQMYAKVKESMK